MTLEPMAKNVPTKAEAISAPDGTMTIKQEKGDVYLHAQQSLAFAKSISQGIDEHISEYIHNTVVVKLNELIEEYDQLLLDIIAGGIPTTAQHVNKITMT